MLITGQFRNVENELFTVKILSDGDSSTTRTIGEDGLYFSADPVQIETDCDNTLEHLIRKSCSINLVCDGYIGDALWASNARNIIVNIKNEATQECVFAGYVEPNSFNQPFAKPLEEFTINCIDAISTLQYYKYKNSNLRTYDSIKQTATTATFKTMLQQMFNDIITTLDIDGDVECRLIYDCTKAIVAGYQKITFNTMAIDESYILGDEFDDCWTNEEVLTEILQYLNLHIVQQGFDFFIYDWGTIKNGRNVWYDVLNDTNVTLARSSTIALTSEMHGADDTNITVDDVYNQFSVKCELENEDVIIESPLENDAITSLFSGKQLYCREYYAESDDKTNIELENFWRMLKGRSAQITFDKGKIVDWYIQAIHNKKWLMHTNNGTGDITDVYTKSGNNYINQWNVAKYVKDNRLTPSLFKFGKIEKDAQNIDNEPKGKVSMSNYLYISVNGNDTDDYNSSLPSITEIQNHSPMIEYISGSSGGTYSPSDDDTTNYLVFSGKIQLQTRQEETANYHTLYTRANYYDDYNVNDWTTFILSSTNGYVDIKDTNKYDSDPNDYKGRLYTRKYYTFENAKTTDIDETQYLVNQVALQPPAESKLKLFYYEYTEPVYWRDNEDLITKLPILECELIIGNKRLIETDVDKYGNSTFQWVTLGQEPTFTYEDDGETYTITTFTLGMNPKMRDYIIGQEYNIQNTVQPTMNLDIEGTAIPIKKSDNLSGTVQFRILGPVNSTWNHVIRRHPTWFRHTKWYENNRVILSHVENIILKDFQCKICTDNAGGEFVGEYNDLIYMSDETDKFINKNDSTTFKFITQLTSAEAIEKGVKNGININAVQYTTNGLPVRTIYNYLTRETAKPEEHYVNQYYLEYCQPRLIMEATMHNNNIDWRNRYTSSVLNRTFFIQSMNQNLKHNTVEITFKEI